MGPGAVTPEPNTEWIHIPHKSISKRGNYHQTTRLARRIQSRGIIIVLPRYLRLPQHQAPQVATGGLGRDDVDDGVPETLQGESQGFRIAEAEAEVVRVGEGVDPVGGGGDPGEEEGEEVEEGDACV